MDKQNVKIVHLSPSRRSERCILYPIRLGWHLLPLQRAGEGYTLAVAVLTLARSFNILVGSCSHDFDQYCSALAAVPARQGCKKISPSLRFQDLGDCPMPLAPSLVTEQMLHVPRCHRV